MNREIPSVRCVNRKITKSEAERALEYAVAIMRLALSQDEDKYGIAVKDWLHEFAGEPAPIHKESGYDTEQALKDVARLEKELGL
jgi:hypothetical protein